MHSAYKAEMGYVLSSSIKNSNERVFHSSEAFKLFLTRNLEIYRIDLIVSCLCFSASFAAGSFSVWLAFTKVEVNPRRTTMD